MIDDWYSIDSSDETKKFQSSVEEMKSQLSAQSIEILEMKSSIEEYKSQLSSHSSEIHDLKRLVQQLSSELISQLSIQQDLVKDIASLKQNHHITHVKQTNELLEELKVLKQRELNLLIREKIPTPFFASTETLLTRKTLL
jgi:chromosome segregation ATPase